MYHVGFAHRSLVEMTKSRYRDGDTGATYASDPDGANIQSHYLGNGHTLLYHRPGLGPSIFERARAAPGSELWADKLRSNLDEKAAYEILESVPGQGMNLNIFPNLMIIASQVQVVDPVAVEHTEISWYATTLPDAPKEANVIRMRIAEDFPNFGEIDDLEMFQRCWEGLQIPEVEWVDFSRGSHIPLEDITGADGAHTASGTMEHTSRGFFDSYKNYMKQEMKLRVG
jgi:hypothetical protein